MHGSSSSKDALVPLLGRLYEEIRAVEVEHGLWAGPNDYRPRIERFHDAVRAYTSGMPRYTQGSRLSIEWLAEDLENLRAIQANPLVKMPGSTRQPVHNQVMVQKPQSMGDPRMAGRMVRAELGERYKQYAVMFAALLAETADMNHNARSEERDFLVEELAQLKHGMKGMSSLDLRKLAGNIVDDPELAAMLAGMLPQGVMAQNAAERAIRDLQNQMDRQKAQLETAHISWLSSQRMLYEEGKDVVKQLHQHGLQMAGKFLAEAMARGGVGAGRGF